MRKPPHFGNPIFQANAFIPDANAPQQALVPTDRELFEAEENVIQHIVKEHSAVIIGRCGFHILQDYPNRISIFLYGDKDFRSYRIQKYYEISPEDADRMILQNDKTRASYCKMYTGKEWVDARNYDLTIDTSKVDVDKAVELILNYLKMRGLTI